MEKGSKCMGSAFAVSRKEPIRIKNSLATWRRHFSSMYNVFATLRNISSFTANNKKRLTFSCKPFSFKKVGMTRFELATTGPPDQYSKPG